MIQRRHPNPDPSQRRCYDCGHLKATNVQWWCTNEDATRWRGTARPAVRNCPFWAPAPPPPVPTAERVKRRARGLWGRAWAARCGDGSLWFRVFGWGLCVEDRRCHSPRFSERHGVATWLRIGPWAVGCLTPRTPKVQP